MITRGRWANTQLTPIAAVTEYNKYINAADIRSLASLMSEDHRFIDTGGHTVSGKPACIAAWAGFFRKFPGYHNTFTKFIESRNAVTILGYSECPHYAELTGPAVWTATTLADRITEWRVYDDTVSNRLALGISE